MSSVSSSASAGTGPAANKALFTRGFSALLVTQFLGACNDNVLKQVVAMQVLAGGLWAGKLGDGGQGLVTFLFTLPFILFSGWSGQFADRNSKQRVARWMKLAEIPIAIGALAALWAGNLWAVLSVLVLLATQATIFGPAKYGMIPELLPDESLPGANGAINMLTNVAIVVGIIIGGMLSDQYRLYPGVPGAVLCAIAVAGYVTSRFLTPLDPSDPNAQYSRNPFAPYVTSLKLMFRNRVLLILAFSSSLFYFTAILIIQAILDFKAILNLRSDYDTSMLMIPLLVGTGIGSALSGLLTHGGARELRMAPAGALGMAGLCVLLGLTRLSPVNTEVACDSPSYWLAGLCFGLEGVFGGIYIVPFLAMIQARAPAEVRGRIMGTTNFLNFVFIAAGGGLYWLLEAAAKLSAQGILVATGLMMLAGSMGLLWPLRGFVISAAARESTAAE